VRWRLPLIAQPSAASDRTLTRRELLAGMGAAAVAGVVGCGDDGTTASSDAAVPTPDSAPDAPAIT